MEVNCGKIANNNIMINASYIKRIIAFIIIVLVILHASGCGQGSNKQSGPQQQQLQTEQESDKVPDQLKEIEENIEKIIKEMDGPSVGTEDKEKKQPEEGTEQQNEGQEGQKGQEQQDKQDSQKQDEGGSQQDQQKQSQAQQKPAQQPQKDPWEKITPIINTMHYKWNDYMPLAVKMGANRKLIDDFSNALNSLTSTIIGKNKTNTLMAASYLYAYIPDFYSLYKTGTSPEIKRIRYYTRNAMLNAMTANWTQADSDMNSLKSSWSLFKNTLSKEQQESGNKLDFSIYELEKVIKERDQPLTDIKGRVAMANIEALEKAMEKEE